MKKLILAGMLVATLISGNSMAMAQSNNYSNLYYNLLDFDKILGEADRVLNKVSTASFYNNSVMRYYDVERNAYVTQINVNGFKKKEISVSLKSRVLRVSGKAIKSNKNSDSKAYFSHAVSLPQDGDANNINTEWKNGMLFIYIPKLDKPQKDFKSIEIK